MDNQPQPIDDRIDKLAESATLRVDLSKAPRNYQEVMNEINPQGEERKVRDMVGETVTILGIRFFSSQYGIASYVIGADQNGELFHCIVGQKVILPKLALVKDQLPIKVTFVKREGGANEGYFDIE